MLACYSCECFKNVNNNNLLELMKILEIDNNLESNIN